MPSQAESVEAYFASLSAFDAERLVALFAPNGELHDPYGTRPWIGPDNLRKFFVRVTKTWARLDMRPESAYAAGNRSAVKWSATGRSHSGKQVSFDGINVFEFGEGGLIERLSGYWDAASVMAQLQS